MSKRLYFYPVWIRLWHLVNALMFLLLIVTGLSMQYGFLAIPFDIAVSIHNISGIILSLCYGFYFLANFISGNLKYYRIKFKGFCGALMLQGRYYAYGIFKKEEEPFPLSGKQKFNPLQKLSYVIIMYLFVPLIIISGCAMLFPQVIYNQILGVPGIAITDLVHVVTGFVGSVFMIIHIYFCTLGKKPSSSFKSMMNGYHEVKQSND